MVKKLSALVLIIAALSSAGCALPRVASDINGAPPVAAPAEAQSGYALVYLSRPRHGYASEVWPNVYLNKAQVVGLKNGSYSYVYVPPGPYTVSARKAQWYSAGWNEALEPLRRQRYLPAAAERL